MSLPKSAKDQLKEQKALELQRRADEKLEKELAKEEAELEKLEVKVEKSKKTK